MSFICFFDRGAIYLAKGIPLTECGKDAFTADERFSYDSIEDTLLGFGVQKLDDDLTYFFDSSDCKNLAAIGTDSDDLNYIVHVYGDSPSPLWEYEPIDYTFTLTINPNTRQCDSVTMYNSID